MVGDYIILFLANIAHVIHFLVFVMGVFFEDCNVTLLNMKFIIITFFVFNKIGIDNWLISFCFQLNDMILVLV